jgi:hypothetical protein
MKYLSVLRYGSNAETCGNCSKKTAGPKIKNKRP